MGEDAVSTVARLNLFPVRLFIGFFAIALSSRALDIRVRLISAKNGRPVPKQNICIDVDGPIEPGHSSGDILTRGCGRTDSSGMALVNISSLIPPGSWALISIPVPLGLCSPDRYSIDRVLSTGVSAEGECLHGRSDKFRVPPKPGEIVLYRR